MLIACPNCQTSYQLADVAISPNGRSVRCSRCQNQWRAMPSSANDGAAIQSHPSPPQAPAESESDMAREPSVNEAYAEPSPDASAIAQDAAEPGEAPPLSLSEIPIPIEHVPPDPADDADSPPVVEMDNGPPDVESVAERRERARARQARWRLPLPMAIAALLLLSAGLVGLRKDVVRHAPQLASFYSAVGMPVNLRGLAFTDLKIGNEIHDGVPVLVVEGVITSVVSQPSDVPRLRFSLRSATGAEVYSWTAPPSQSVLGPFESLPFRTRLASPPADGHDIQVRFFTRRDAVAGLR
jgi:predicted Zn finger-like uncharacterized protein